MKKISLFILACLVLFGCKESSTTGDDTIHGSGVITTQDRTVSDCSGILVKSVGNVYLTQGNSQSIHIEADDNIIDKVLTRNENGILVAGLEDGSYSNITLKIYVTLKSVGHLSIEGAGTITANDSITCGGIESVITGAGNITLKGNADSLRCTINGAGNFYAEHFIVKRCIALVNGTGNITVNVTDALNATVIGVGTINYYGNPSLVATSITGLGQIIEK